MSDIDETLRETYANLRGSFESDFTPETKEAKEVAELDEVEAAGNEAGNDDQAGSEDAGNADASGEEDQGAGEAENASGEEDQQQQQSATFRPPWKKAALAEWENLPELARKEIERREADFHKGIEQYKTGAQTAQEFERAVAPYMATIQGFGITPVAAAAHLMNVDHQLRHSAIPQKVGMLLKIANDYGVDINTLATGIQQIAGERVWEQQNPIDPRMQQLQARVDQMQQQQLQTQQQAVQAEHSAIDSEIAAFAADPDHEHFGLLQKDMAILLQNGMAKTLGDAYEMAMRQNPQTYQIWLAQQQQEWDAQRKAKVAKAKQAGANVVRPNGRASVPAAQPARSMEQDIEATARALGLLN